MVPAPPLLLSCSGVIPIPLPVPTAASTQYPYDDGAAMKHRAAHEDTVPSGAYASMLVRACAPRASNPGREKKSHR
ncbi:hypothetical protein B0H13DRAFT_2336184 [Mycena leptocephala]|nr:hypothetical protein B0H13DRAFT_2336184 [Mycena leptocephala]